MMRVISAMRAIRLMRVMRVMRKSTKKKLNQSGAERLPGPSGPKLIKNAYFPSNSHQHASEHHVTFPAKFISPAKLTNIRFFGHISSNK